MVNLAEIEQFSEYIDTMERRGRTILVREESGHVVVWCTYLLYTSVSMAKLSSQVKNWWEPRLDEPEGDVILWDRLISLVPWTVSLRKQLEQAAVRAHPHLTTHVWGRPGKRFVVRSIRRQNVQEIHD